MPSKESNNKGQDSKNIVSVKIKDEVKKECSVPSRQSLPSIHEQIAAIKANNSI